MNYFIGEYRYTLDDKGRVNIPAKFRKATSGETEGKFIIYYDEEDNCLYVYPNDLFEKKIVNFIDKLSEAKKEHRAYMSMVGENSTDASLDKQGRITIPPNFLKKAGIKKEVLIIGSFNKIEIWNPEVRAGFKETLGGAQAKAKLEERIAKDLESEKS